MEIIFMVALVATSIVAVTFIVERAIALQKHKVIPPAIEDAIEVYRSAADLGTLRKTCEYHPSTIGRLILFATDHLAWAKNENIDVLETRARHEVTRLEKNLVVLEIIVGIAPLLGLVGTIAGLILLFNSMGGTDMADKAAFAKGIGVALWATLLGLVIAIPALTAWSYFSKKVETMAVEMESLCDELLRKHYQSIDAGERNEPVQTQLAPTANQPHPHKSRFVP